MKNYEFFYSVMTNSILKESDEIFSCDGVCLKHGLIKLARHFASLPDYRLDRYQVAVGYSVEDCDTGDYKWDDLSQDDFTFMFYYISNFQQYKQETKSND